MRTLAIGDIHGCNTALTVLLRRVQPRPSDRVVFLGDYIDRGPASRDVIESLLDLREKTAAVFLRGNHEAMILEARDNGLKANLWQGYGGLEALVSYGGDCASLHANWVSLIPERHWEFLAGTRKFFETDDDIFVHASLDPELELADQPDEFLFWEHFDTLQPHLSGKRIICGHSPQRLGHIRDVGFATCIDTGPAAGGWLTCLDTDSGEFWQANERGKVRQGVL